MVSREQLAERLKRLSPDEIRRLPELAGRGFSDDLSSNPSVNEILDKFSRWVEKHDPCLAGMLYLVAGGGDQPQHYQYLRRIIVPYRSPKYESFAAVYQVYNPQHSRIEAHKQLPSTIDADHRQYLERLAGFSDRNFVAIHELGGAALVMDFVPLQYMLLREWQGPRIGEPAKILAVYIQIGEAFARLHDKGLVHRNFKPDNVFIEVDDHDEAVSEKVRIAGYGVQPNNVEYRGLPYYASPEHCERGVVDAKSDQFSFCVALYEALFNDYPISNARTTMRSAARDDREPLVVHSELLRTGKFHFKGEPPKALARVVEHLARGLERARNDRHASMAALVSLLKIELRAMQQQSIVVKLTKSERSLVRRPQAFVAGWVVFVVAAVTASHARLSCTTKAPELMSQPVLSTPMAPETTNMHPRK